jgi:hypothetical protein
MNTMKTNISERGRCRCSGRAPAGLALAVVVAGCSVTRKEAPVLVGGHCALIPPNTGALLTPAPCGAMGLRYVVPNVQWS